ncbi:MAG: metal-dependent transcriptional regulator [Oscillospiraceae bacterium]|nr:metal-dependent transcriptional regulator [Oscillospiraceae bacterium]
MKIHESAENYLETILVLHQRKGSVRSIDIANELEFSKPSVSVAMKNLRLKGYIEMDASGLIHLLPEGRAIAEAVLEKHRLMTQFLMALGVREEVAAEDACRIEHVLSDESFEAIKEHARKYSNL